MLRYFRINDPYRLVGLLVIMVLLCLPLFIDAPALSIPELKSMVLGEKIAEGFSPYTEVIDSTPPLAAWFYGLCDIVFGRSDFARHLTAFIILFFQSCFLGIVLIDKKAFNENTYIPSLLFSLLTFLSFDMLALTAELPAFGFLLLALNSLFKELEFGAERGESTFNLGLYIGIASLLVFSYTVYLPGALLIMALFTRSNARKYLLLMFGFLVPHLALILFHYLNGTIGSVWEFFYLSNFTVFNLSLVSLQSLLWLCGLPMLFLFISLFVLNRDAHLTKYQTQLFQTFFIWFLIGLVQVYLSRDIRPQTLLSLVPSIAFFLTHYLLIIQRRKYAELALWIFFLGVTSIAYLSRYNRISSIQYQPLYVTTPNVSVVNKKILVVGNDVSAYTNNALAAPFSDWLVGEKIFTNPDYYENVLLVNRILQKDLPEIIVDPNNLMGDYFDRLPMLAAFYEKSAEGYRLTKINN